MSQELTHAFRSLHDDLLILPNAWDAASTRLMVRAGAQAVATSSSAVSWSHGYPDGNNLPFELALATIARIVHTVDVPVSADIESGYTTEDDQLAQNVRAVIDAGAAGVNFEDSTQSGLLELAEAARRSGVVRAAAEASGVELFINARTDIFLTGNPPADGVEQVIARGQAFLDAGASGLFVPGLHDLTKLAEITAAIDAPVNVLAGPGAPSVAEFKAAGVRRVSVGNDIAGIAYATAENAAKRILETGEFDSLEGAAEYGQMQQLF
ncbi:PEP phosphonomutase [Renibacterium salmoninarum ATCC 33209]|uniref:PEP phosphonomutase n=1 Tax=Renibacterium salmoninarum (strain ATCC 33209 / DSM 20767 / JCM 11484 / NBRC 15589 / NCIMB 2235) TaxID=288705 RepID=A9WM41_RENSM|nr:isocitrate lyase/phosphoenolpyruvate mutase family protein [Renibacterium salmoninarum]ABY22029.1 PEP phosphonomutase [Renibacterium salmoninarum ATCC 33209]